MSWQKNLIQWHEKGFIDAQTRAMIETYEASQPRLTDTLWRLGLVGLGVLCLGVGLWFVVAANWQSIPFDLKLGAHMTLNIALAVWVLYTLLPGRKFPPLAREVPLILLAMGQLSLMALIGQYFQIDSSFEDVMLFWWFLIAPMLVLLGWSFLSALLFTVLGLYVLYAQFHFLFDSLFAPFFSVSLAVYLCSLLPIVSEHRPGWQRVLSNVGFYSIVAITTCITMEPDLFFRYNKDVPIFHIFAGALLTFFFVCFSQARKAFFGPQDDTFKEQALVLSLITATIGQLFGTVSNQTFETVLFCLYFLGLGWLGYRHQHRGFISLAILFVAGRIMVYFATLSNNMMINGLVMIAIGSIALVVLNKLVWKKGARHA